MRAAHCRPCRAACLQTVIEFRSRRARSAAALRIDAVEMLPTDLATTLVRVAGAWEGGPLSEGSRACVLILGGASGEHRVESLPETSSAAARVAPEERPFRAAFSVPDRLVGLLSGPLRLDVDGVAVDLPAASGPAGEPVEQVEGTVVDGAVLVERRARRAELAEAAAARRAQEAERAVARMEAELARLELGLLRADDERAALEFELDRRERELRASRQHAHAEQRLREDAVSGADRRVAQAEHEAGELREALAHVDRRARDLEGELAAARRGADEAEQRTGTANARAGRVQRAAKGREHRVAQDLAVLRAELALASSPPLRPPAPRIAGAGPDHGAATLLEHERRAAEVVRDHVGAARLRTRAEVHDHALAEAESAVSEAHAAAAQARRRLGRERHDRAQGEVELGERILGLAREANSLRAQTDAERRAREAAHAECQALSRARSEVEAELATLAATATDPPEQAPQVAPDTAPEPEPGHERPWLTIGLERLVTENATAAARLALEVLPGQALSSRSVSYDLHVGTLGWHEVTLGPGEGRVIGRHRARDGDEAAFALGATPAALVSLVTEGGSRRLRRRGVRVSGTMRRGRALRSLAAVPLDPGALADAGIWIDPLLFHRALALSIEPDWTRGHEFCLEHTVEERRGGRCFITVSDGEPVGVRNRPPAGGATTTVRTSHRAFQHALGGGAGKPVVGEGDIGALALLVGWARRGAPR